MLDRITGDMKQALKEGDKLKVSVLRLAMAELQNARISKGGDLEEGEELAVLQKSVKKHEESAEAFRAGGRDEQANAEEAGAQLLRGYLPRALSDDELTAAVETVIAELGATSKREMGGVMRTMMSRYRGRVDGKKVQELVAGLLP